MCSDLLCFSIFSHLSPQQIRRHGAQNDRREDLWLHLLPQRRAGDRPSRARHRVQLQSHLPPEPESRQAARSEGKRGANTSGHPICCAGPTLLCPSCTLASVRPLAALALDFQMSSRIVGIMRMKGNFKCWVITAGGWILMAASGNLLKLFYHLHAIEIKTQDEIGNRFRV